MAQNCSLDTGAAHKRDKGCAKEEEGRAYIRCNELTHPTFRNDVGHLASLVLAQSCLSCHTADAKAA